MIPNYNPTVLVSTSQAVQFAGHTSSSSSAPTIRLHPFVVMNFFNHLTRLKEDDACNGISCSKEATAAQLPRIFGCLIGVQRGQAVEIFNSFELVLDPVSETLNLAFLKKKQEQYKKVFPSFDVVGWYTIGSSLQDSDMQIHKAFMDFGKRPVYLLLNPAFDLSQKDLPVTIYESELRVIDGNVEVHFVKSNYTIETVEAEKISTVNGAHLKPSPLSLSGAASTAESPEQEYSLVNPSYREESPYREKAKPFQKVLLETPSGFAMFEVSRMVLRDPEIIWAFFTRISAARKAVYTLGFVKVDKSVSRDSDVGPGKELEEFILRFCDDKPLIVPDLQLKAVIEGKLKVKCWFEKEIVHELMWGLNYALAAFVPEEKGYPVNECPLSKHLEQRIKIHRFNVSLQKIDREFIDMLGYLVEAQCLSSTIPMFLRCKFDRWVHMAQRDTDIDFAKKVADFIKRPQAPLAEILKDSKHTKEDREVH